MEKYKPTGSHRHICLHSQIQTLRRSRHVGVWICLSLHHSKPSSSICNLLQSGFFRTLFRATPSQELIITAYYLLRFEHLLFKLQAFCLVGYSSTSTSSRTFVQFCSSKQSSFIYHSIYSFHLIFFFLYSFANIKEIQLCSIEFCGTFHSSDECHFLWLCSYIFYFLPSLSLFMFHFYIIVQG